MRVIIAGNYLTDTAEVQRALELSEFDITEVVGTQADLYAHWLDVPYKRFKTGYADRIAWGDDPATYFCNVEMVQYAQAMVLVWDGKDPNAAQLRRIARMQRLPLFERVLDGTWF